MTDAEVDIMNEAFGYLKCPTEIYAVAKQGSAGK
jgi:hypothetical protein